MKQKIVLMDGATGTRLWALAEAAGYEKAPVWTYNLTHPELVARVAEEYIAAGSTLLCSNTFAANGPEVARVPGMAVGEVVAAGVRIAKEAAAGTDVRVALDVGPLSAMLEPFGPTTPEQAAACFAELLGAGVDAGADCIFLETFTSLEMLSIALAEAKRFPLPVLCSMSFDRSSGRTMMGDSVPEICTALEAGGADAVGMNCSFGPAAAVPIIRDYAAHAALPLILKPNADVGAEEFAAALAPALPLAAYVGACCGSDPDYIRALARRIAEAGATG